MSERATLQNQRSIRTPATRLLLIGFSALVFAGCGDSGGDSGEMEQAAAVCGALSEERFEDAIRLSESGASAHGAGREIAECRCIALLSVGDRERCTQLLDPLLRADEARDWLPHVVLTKLMLRTWQAAGQSQLAAPLAERAAPVYRNDLDLLQLEIMLRSTTEDEADLLHRIETRLTADLDWLPQRLVLALAWNRRSRFEESLRVLGESPPPIAHPLALPWYESRIQAEAAAGDLAAVRATFETWRATGWDPVDLQARYALRVSVDQLRDPEHHTIQLLRDAIATQDQLSDRNIVWGLQRRLIQELLAAGQPTAALAAYDAAVAVVALDGITREEIERAVRLAEGTISTGTPATLRFHAPPGFGIGELLVSPGPEEPADADYRAHRLSEDTPTSVATHLGLHPQRWVLRGPRGNVRASGAVWPEPGQTIDVRPEMANASTSIATPVRVAAEGQAAMTRRPADGRRRVFAILADCGDWRLTEYLMARGELPFTDHLFNEGHRAVLESRPAFTAAAMQALVWPSKATQTGSLGWIHHLGLEFAGLESIGRNPVEWLSLVLPSRPNLFETLGSGSLVAANMLMTHGRIDAGRHAEVVGPTGARRDLPSQNAYRVLDAGERARHPALLQNADSKKFAETIAAEMDAAEKILRQGEVDFLFLRLETLDLLTHASFGPLDGRGQDDAQGPLLAAYRYIDERLAALHALMDEDDWLVYLSDHGIRSSMQHEEDAIFVVLGDGVPAGRAPGRPALRGVPRSLAAMLQVETNWPDTGMAAWLPLAVSEPDFQRKARLDAQPDSLSDQDAETPAIAARP